MFRYHRLVLLILGGLLFSGPVVMASDLNKLQDDLEARLSAYRAQQTFMHDFIKKVSQMEGEVRRLEISVDNRHKAMDAAQEKLVIVQQLILSHPEISDARERSQYADAKKAYEENQQELARALSDQARAQQDLQIEKTVLNNIENEINSLRQRIADVHFSQLKVEIEREREVLAHGETSCGIMSIQMCMEAALDQARRNAAETGSAVIIDSFTEVKDFELKRDEIRSRVRAIVLRHEVLDSGFIGHSGYYYKIRAIVKGQVPPDFTQVVVTPPVREPDPRPPAAASAVAPEPAPAPFVPPPAPAPAPTDAASTYRLTVYPDPPEARVRIMNISPPYQPGIRLAPGNYHIEVSSPGYQTANQWIDIQDADKTLFITLSSTIAVASPRASESSQEAPPAAAPPIPASIKALIAQLQSGSPSTVRTAAMNIHRSEQFHPEVLKVVNSTLRNGYNTNLNDRNHVDAMAWLCNILGTAGARQYKNTLEMIVERSENRKVRNYAARNLRNL